MRTTPLLFTSLDLRGVHLVEPSQLIGRLLSPDHLQSHLGLERRTVPLSLTHLSRLRSVLSDPRDYLNHWS